MNPQDAKEAWRVESKILLTHGRTAGKRSELGNEAWNEKGRLENLCGAHTDESVSRVKERHCHEEQFVFQKEEFQRGRDERECVCIFDGLCLW